MTKIMAIISLFLGCRLLWIWVDQCGADLGMGETLPFCLACSGFVSFLRLLILCGVVFFIYKVLKTEADETDIYQNYLDEIHTIRIHWHRIFLLLFIISYPLWVWWVDKNTTIPGPGEIFIFQASCKYSGFKGTLLWIIEMLFVSIGFKIIHNENL